jgi:hypothetical protein
MYYRNIIIIITDILITNKAQNKLSECKHKIRELCTGSSFKKLFDTKNTSVNFYSILSMALQSSVGPWPLFQFLNPIYSR